MIIIEILSDSLPIGRIPLKEPDAVPSEPQAQIPIISLCILSKFADSPEAYRKITKQDTLFSNDQN